MVRVVITLQYIIAIIIIIICGIGLCVLLRVSKGLLFELQYMYVDKRIVHMIFTLLCIYFPLSFTFSTRVRKKGLVD